MARVYVGVGSNIRPEANVHEALRMLSEKARILGVSTFYRTPPENGAAQPLFWNGVVSCETDLPPWVLKHSVLRRIEAALGRERTADKNAPRTIDLDIIVYHDPAFTRGPLAFSDPDILHRDFLAVPLAELAPDLVLPGLGHSIRDVVARLPPFTLHPLHDDTRRLREALTNGPQVIP